MRVGQDAPPRNDEAAAGGGVLPLPLPRQREVGLRVHAEHLRARDAPWLLCDCRA